MKALNNDTAEKGERYAKISVYKSAFSELNISDEQVICANSVIAAQKALSGTQFDILCWT